MGERADAARIDGLDGWRTISVFLVIAYHLQTRSGVAASLPIRLGDYGVLGVEFFFVISGFVITRGFLREERASGRISLTGFYLRRVFRILPPLILYVSVVATLAYLGWVEADGIGRALLFTCNLPGATCGGYLGKHTWSLAYEEQFYLLIPLLFVLLGRSRMIGLLALALAIPASAIALHAIKWHTAADFVGEFASIGVGVAAALTEPFVRRASAAIPLWAPAAAFVAILAIRALPASAPATVALITLTGPLVATALFGSSFREGRFQRFLVSTPMLSLGRASYGIYLWQQLATYPGWGDSILVYVLAIGGSVLLALVLFHGLEKPIIKLGHRLSARLARRGGRGDAVGSSLADSAKPLASPGEPR